MKKINLLLRAALILFLSSSFAYAESTDLAYLNVGAVNVSSFDTMADWAPIPDIRATVDGSLLTRWSSQYKDGEWIVYDFITPKVLSKIIIFWENAYAVDYDIFVSQDNENWQEISAFKEQTGGVKEIEFSPVNARFVKIISKKRVNPTWGISIWETLFFGPAAENPQDKPLAEVYPELAKQLTEKPDTAPVVTAREPEKKQESAVASPGALSLVEFQKGIVYTSWGKKELAGEASDLTLEYLKGLGIRNIAIMVVWMQDTIKEKEIYADPKDTVEDSALAHAINKAHSLGIKVMLKPHVDVKNGEWRGDIIPSAEWFESYRQYITRYAKFAAEYNVELFCIGTEYTNTATPAWQKQWSDVIKGIREVFPGKITYSANWNEYRDVTIWDELDFIGISAYFPLTNRKDPSKEELVSSWKINAMEIDRWLKEKKFSAPLIFTEVGYCSADGANKEPWVTVTDTTKYKIDEQEQADCLEAMLTVCPSYDWFKGFYLWNYFPQKTWSPLSYPIRGKKAEEVLVNWLKNKAG